MSRRYWLALLVAAVVFFIIVNLPQPEPERDELPPELAGEPDFYMRDAEIVQHDEQGAIRYRLLAREIRHFEAAAHTELQLPRLTMYRAGEPPWHGRAERGNVRTLMHRDGSSEEVVRLRDDVELRREANARPEIVLTTEELRVFPDRRYAETERAVIIETRGTRTSGVGLRGSLDDGVIHLGSDSQQRVDSVVQGRQGSGDS